MNINYFKEKSKPDDSPQTSRLHTFRKKLSLIFKQEAFIIVLSVARLTFFVNDDHNYTPHNEHCYY